MDAVSNLSRAADWLREAENIVVFSGAGVSAESGIPTFRDEGGVWDRFPPEQFATPSGLLATAARQPHRVAEFIIGLLEPIAEAAPNAAHLAVAELEKHAGVTVVTQNIDGLHHDAGSTTVWEVHGSVFQIVDQAGRQLRRVSRSDLRAVVDALRQTLADGFQLDQARQAVRPVLDFGPQGYCRPDIVLFGEAMAEPAWTKAREASEECDCMLIVGTSGAVYPAAMLPEQAKSAGANIIAVGPERCFCDLWLRGTAGAVLPALLKLVSGQGT